MLQKLADAPGPSGFEEPVRKLMTDYMQPLATSIRYDGMGSIIAAHRSTGPRVMVDAHMDELGGMIRRITPNGFLSMQMLGGWLDQALVDQRWVIIGSKGAVHAVTGIRDIHVIPADERTRVFPATGSTWMSARRARPRFEPWVFPRVILWLPTRLSSH